MKSLEVPELGIQIIVEDGPAGCELVVKSLGDANTSRQSSIYVFGFGAITSSQDAAELWSALAARHGSDGHHGALLRLGSHLGDCRLIMAGEWIKEFASAASLQNYIEAAGEYGAWWPATFHHIERLGRSARFGGSSIELFIFLDRTGRQPYRWSNEVIAAWVKRRGEMAGRPDTQIILVGSRDASESFSGLVQRMRLSDWLRLSPAGKAQPEKSAQIMIELPARLSTESIKALTPKCTVVPLSDRAIAKFELMGLGSQGTKLLTIKGATANAASVQKQGPRISVTIS